MILIEQHRNKLKKEKKRLERNITIYFSKPVLKRAFYNNGERINYSLYIF